MNKKVKILISILTFLIVIVTILIMFGKNDSNNQKSDIKNDKKETKKDIKQEEKEQDKNNETETKTEEKEKEKNITYKNNIKTEVIKYKTIKNNDPTLENNREVVDINGSNGERTTISLEKYEDNKLIETSVITTYKSKEVTNKIVRVGTKTGPLKTKKTEKKQEEIDFKTKVEYDASLPKGEEKIKQQGKKGLKEITEEITFEDSKEVSRKTISEKVIRKPIDKIIVKGTKSANKKTKTFNTASEARTWAESEIDKPSSPFYKGSFTITEFKDADNNLKYSAELRSK